MLGKMNGGAGRRPSGQLKSWQTCLLDNLKAYDATKGSTEHSNLCFGVKVEVSTVTAKKTCKWYRVVYFLLVRFRN